MWKRSFPLAIACAFLLFACSASEESTVTSAPANATTATDPMETNPSVTLKSGASTYTPIYEPSDCEFIQPDGYIVECGYLVVPENRADPYAGVVRIHVAIFPSTTNSPSLDPVIYLEGGPGGHALDGLQFSFDQRFAPFLDRNDLIVFDQRGTGMSTPSLACPEVRQTEIDLLNQLLTPQQQTARYNQSLAECRDRLTADGIDIAQYNSSSNAADLADLRTVLGYEEINLYGISYGTRLALTAMRDHPAGIRSVILDSAVPLDIDLPEQIPSTAARAFDAFFDSCSASIECGASYPDLKESFTTLQSTLNASPASVEINDFLTDTSYPAYLTGDDVALLLFQSLYSESLIPILPDMIDDASQGSYSGLSDLASIFFTNDVFMSIGMHLSVQCNEEYAFSSVAKVEAEIALHPDVAPLFRDVAGDFAACTLWNSGSADPIENIAVASSVPTLVLGGQFDPITPPQYGERAATTLSNSYFFTYPGLGHGVSTAHPCPLSMMLAFLEEPGANPEDSCITTMKEPVFIVPGAISVDLISVTEETFGLTLSVVIPTGWKWAGPGQWNAPGLGDTVLLQQALHANDYSSIHDMADDIADSIGIREWQTWTYQEERNWNLFEASDEKLSYVFGLAEDAENLLIVLLAAPSDLIADYEEQVFAPALEAIRVR